MLCGAIHLLYIDQSRDIGMPSFAKLSAPHNTMISWRECQALLQTGSCLYADFSKAGMHTLHLLSLRKLVCLYKCLAHESN